MNPKPAPLRIATVPQNPASAPAPNTIVSELEFDAGAQVTLSDASPGVVYHPDRGTVEWTPAILSKEAEARALFIIKNPDGSEEIRVHVIPRAK